MITDGIRSGLYMISQSELSLSVHSLSLSRYIMVTTLLRIVVPR